MTDEEIKLTQDEQKLIDHAKEAVVKYNTARHKTGGIDTLYAFVMSDSGIIYDGACIESNIGGLGICAERHAIMNMLLAEGYSAKVKIAVVANPVPQEQENGTQPCGACRHFLFDFGSADTMVILMQYIFHDDEKNNWSWTFHKIEKITLKELYPHAYKPIEGLWD